jgi:hypothetical protein
MRIEIQTIAHEAQRYDTAGDWWIDEAGTWQIRVSSMRSFAFEFLVALHELIEMALCWHRNILDDEVTEFDTHWKPFPGCTEPGDDMAAPYYHEHQYASGVERLTASELNVNWVEYCRVVDALGCRVPARPLPHGESNDGDED